MIKINKLILLLIACSVAQSINAYENSFYNNTDEPIGIAIQYTGNDGSEPLYKKLIKPNSFYNFTPGNTEIPQIKWGFCLETIYYIENPTSEQKAHNFAKATWKKIPITWSESKSTTKKQSKKKTSFKHAVQELATSEKKSRCRDRHFDITRDEHGKIVITSSLQD